MPFSLRSAAFVPLAAIPRQFTCDGPDRAPPLSWSDVPKGTKSLALVMEDRGTAAEGPTPASSPTHWLLYDLPPRATGLPEAVGYPPGTRVGKNHWKRAGYTGPCPQSGRHRYFFTLFALDCVLGDLKSPSRTQLDAAMAGHIVARAVLMGTYERSRKAG